jgi:hypothetical protein
MAVTIELYGEDYDLELAMLRQSVAAVNIARNRCTACERTALIGEYLFRYADGTVDCELCRAVRRDLQPAAREQVRQAGGRLTVHALARSST